MCMWRNAFYCCLCELDVQLVTMETQWNLETRASRVSAMVTVSTHKVVICVTVRRVSVYRARTTLKELTVNAVSEDITAPRWWVIAKVGHNSDHKRRSSVTFGGQDIFAGKYMREKLTKCPNFTWYMAPEKKISKMPEFYLIFARKIFFSYAYDSNVVSSPCSWFQYQSREGKIQSSLGLQLYRLVLRLLPVFHSWHGD